MPVFRNRVTLDLGQNVRLRFGIEMELAGAGVAAKRLASRLGLRKASSNSGSRPTGQSASTNDKDQVVDGRSPLSIQNRNRNGKGIKPENIVWIFGTGRSGSTWLGNMMGDHDNRALWHEPYVGEVFGTAYYVRAWEKQRARGEFILSDPYKQVWLSSIRNFVLDGANARFSSDTEYLVVKEPHGSIAAPILMEALPESRMLFLVRDPRDVAASRLDAHRKGSWTSRLTGNEQATLADKNPDAFVKAAANMYRKDMENSWQAYKEFDGRKSIVKYEDLRYDALRELERIYSELEIPSKAEDLRRVVDKHAWENIPENRKGMGKTHRKAKPGGWQEDLTPEQARSVEQIAAPLLKEFYPG